MSNLKEWQSNLLSVVIFVSVLSAIYAPILFWNNIESFFASSPQAKCEAFLDENNNDEYCKYDGEKASHSEDTEIACIDKEPYFEYDSSTNKCDRVKYASKKACQDDGREESKNFDGEIYGSRCLDDGTWELYDAEYESYLIDKAVDETYSNQSENCNPNYSPCVPNVNYNLDCNDVSGPVNVIGYDEYFLDADGDGVGCEPYYN